MTLYEAIDWCRANPGRRVLGTHPDPAWGNPAIMDWDEEDELVRWEEDDMCLLVTKFTLDAMYSEVTP